jgi:uncharacterized protein YjbI with pentapeptide repeats
MAMKFQIKSRWTASVLFEAEIEASADTPFRIQLGLAVRKAYESGAYLRGADLRGADLSGAYLSGEKVSRLIAIAERLDGYTFHAFELQTGGVKIKAGCRWFTPAEYRAHIANEYPGSSKAIETLAILDFIERRATELNVAAPSETKEAA